MMKTIRIYQKGEGGGGAQAYNSLKKGIIEPSYH
jgi:hypothetical protein